MSARLPPDGKRPSVTTLCKCSTLSPACDSGDAPPPPPPPGVPAAFPSDGIVFSGCQLVLNAFCLLLRLLLAFLHAFVPQARLPPRDP